MRALLLTAAAVLGFGLLLSVHRPGTGTHRSPQTKAAESQNAIGSVDVPMATSSIASYPDRGELLAYDHRRQVLHSGASTWQPVQVSEQHALRAIVEGGMNVRTPNGEIIHLRYERHVEHPDGNWTWIGRKDGGAPGTETILTFGEKAVFGTIRQGNADLSVTTQAGSTWLVETDYSRVDHNGIGANNDDFLVTADRQEPMATGMPKLAASSPALAPIAAAASATSVTPTTIDIAMGFTTGFATRLGGQSQAQTRLRFLVDVANEAYLASGISAQLRLVHAVQVNYADGTHNDSALMDLTGVDCTEAANGAHYRSSARYDCTPRAHPAALQPLVSARATYGADLLVLIRKFEASSTSCGVAWLLGGGQNPISSSSAAYATSVVNDSSGDMFPSNGTTCPDVHLAHELGHNMGQQHDVVTARGSDDSDGNGNLLDPEEFGRHTYSFGYSTDGTSSDIATIMSNRRPGQTRYRVFANPRISSCGGAPCGNTTQADNARSMMQTMPAVAAFLPARDPSAGNWLQGDFDGDGRSDVLWHKDNTGSNLYWRGANSATRQSLATVSDLAWVIAGIGDFNGDGKSDLLWRNRAIGSNTYWRSGNASTRQAVAPVTDLAWLVAGIGDFNGDGRSDVLWRNTRTGVNAIWNSANTATRTPVASATLAWSVEAVGDFNRDGKADIFWRNQATGANATWFSANSATRQSSQATTAWQVATAADFNGDGRADILWRNSITGANIVWWSGSSATRNSITTVSDLGWKVVGAGDFDHDGKADVLWRHSRTGANMIWKGANSKAPLPISGVSDLNWVVG
ncbi:FG-GAP-like repeat-containing protein [Lysobacter niabensis]|uniref:FG-GAP-like repeat-containing protein n=1 Tax=Agrilutibacter niabensis TaxID=380628 RepID=UPI003615F8B5